MVLVHQLGYVVFYPNPRGSTSYGEEFGNLLYRNYPVPNILSLRLT